ncbi:MAG: glycosyltransferase family 4 protein [Bacteroidales bacterium]
MKILITAPSLDPKRNVSGISSVVLSIIQNSKQEYFHYTLGKADNASSKIKRIFNTIKSLLLFPIFLKRNRIDLVHDNLPFNPKGMVREAIIILWSRLLSVPILLHVHGGEYLMKKCSNPILLFIIRFIFSSVKKVIVLSEIEKLSIKNLYNVDSEVLYNAVDTNFYKPLRSREEGEKKTIIFIGRLHESKGLEDLLAAFKMLYPKKPFRFILCGEGNLKANIVNTLSSFMGDDFEYKGVVSGDQKRNIIQNADIFVLPSRYGEGLPISLLEAMSCGLIPITTDDASMKFIIKDGVNGFFVEKKNSYDLEHKLLKVITLPSSFYENISKNARESITEKYNLEKFIANLEANYNSIKKVI